MNKNKRKYTYALAGFALGSFFASFMFFLDYFLINSKEGSSPEFLHLIYEVMLIGSVGAIIAYVFCMIEMRRKAKFGESTELQEKYKTMISNISDVIAVMNMDGIITYKSPNISLHFGWKPEELIGKEGWMTVHPTDMERVQRAFKLIMLKENRTADIEYLYRCKDGNHKMIHLKAINLLKNPNINGILMNYHDITDKREAVIALKDKEDKYRILFDNMPDGVCILDENGVVQDINASAANIIGYSKEELKGRRIIDHVYPEDLEKSKHYFQMIKEKGFYKNYEGRLITKANEVKWVQVSSVGKFKKDKLIGSQDILRDISERKEMELSLQKSALQLHELNATKDKFFSIIAHDLKSPFNNLLGISNLLNESLINEDKRPTEKYAGLLHDTLENTYELLSNLLDWSLTQQGKIHFKPEHINVIEFIQVLIQPLQKTALLKKIDLNTTIEENINVFADKNLLSGILRNLVTNAIKFTEENGTVDLEVVREADNIQFTISDTGIGMSEKRRISLFRIGEIESTTGTMNEAGTGLGLILCKEFVERHNGSIWVESEEGRGSKFSFTIPKTS